MICLCEKKKNNWINFLNAIFHHCRFWLVENKRNLEPYERFVTCFMFLFPILEFLIDHITPDRPIFSLDYNFVLFSRINLFLNMLVLLSQVISKLTDGRATHIPYRDSKLTRLLQSSLSGHGRVSVSLSRYLYWKQYDIYLLWIVDDFGNIYEAI